jgi:hypothetical protein
VVPREREDQIMGARSEGHDFKLEALESEYSYRLGNKY